MLKKLLINILFFVMGMSVVQLYGLNISNNIQDLTAYIKTMKFTLDGTPSTIGNIKINADGGYGTNNRGYLYMSGDLRVGKGGGNALFVNGTNGRVGIGTTDPGYKLHVVGDIRGDNNIYVGGNIGVGTTSPNHKLDVRGNIYTSNYSLVEQGILVGNGISTPNRDIHVYRDSGNNAEIDIQSVDGVNKHYSLYHDRGSDQFRIRGNNRNSITVYKNGNVSIGDSYATDPTAPLDVAGDLKVGNSGVGCYAANVGKIRVSGSAFQFCDGSNRVNLGLPTCSEGQFLKYSGGGYQCGVM